MCVCGRALERGVLIIWACFSFGRYVCSAFRTLSCRVPFQLADMCAVSGVHNGCALLCNTSSPLMHMRWQSSQPEIGGLAWTPWLSLLERHDGIQGQLPGRHVGCFCCISGLDVSLHCAWRGFWRCHVTQRLAAALLDFWASLVIRDSF